MLIYINCSKKYIYKIYNITYEIKNIYYITFISCGK